MNEELEQLAEYLKDRVFDEKEKSKELKKRFEEIESKMSDAQDSKYDTICALEEIQDAIEADSWEEQDKILKELTGKTYNEWDSEIYSIYAWMPSDYQC